MYGTIVKLENEWYLADPTWEINFFLLGKDGATSHHIVDNPWVDIWSGNTPTLSETKYVPSAIIPEDPIKPKVELLSYYYGRELLNTDAKKNAFDLLVSTLINLDETKISALTETSPLDNTSKEVIIDFAQFALDSASIDTIRQYAFYSEPRLFHMSMELGEQEQPLNLEKNQNGKVDKASFFIKSDYCATPSLYETRMVAIDEQADRYLALTTSAMSDYEKHEVLFQYSTIIGAFMGKIVPSDGYSFGYLYLMQKAGLEGLWVQGNASDPTAEHVWNYVKLENEWYLADAAVGADAFLLGKEGTVEYHIADSPLRDVWYGMTPELSEYDYSPISAIR